jgi:hypothetical protein
MWTRYFHNILLTCSIIIGLFIAAEIIIRYIEPKESNFDFIISKPGTKRLYELRANSNGHLLGRRISINSLGIRDYEIQEHKTEGTYRIIILGDSITMGAGVDIEDIYSKKLESLLNLRSKTNKFEALNFGIWGYNSVQEVDFFESKGLNLSPDLVLVGFFPNDASKTSSLEIKHDSFLYKFANNSHFVRFLKPRLAALGRKVNLPVKTYISSLDNDFEDESSSWKECQASLRRLKTLSYQYNFKLAVVIIPMAVDLTSKYPLYEIHQKLIRFCQKEGITCWDALSAFENVRASTLWTSITDSHFISKGHSILAHFLYGKFADLLTSSDSGLK